MKALLLLPIFLLALVFPVKKLDFDSRCAGRGAGSKVGQGTPVC